MNIDNLNLVIDLLHREDADQHFDMEDFIQGTDGKVLTKDEFFNKCGTSACIGGLVNLLVNGTTSDASVCYTRLGAEFFDLEEEMVEDIFFPGGLADQGSAYEATAVQAATVLEHLRDSGKLDWNVAGPYVDRR